MRITPTATAWLEGVKAFQDGRSRNSNPYSKMPMEASAAVDLSIQWFAGWDTSAIIISPKTFGTVSELEQNMESHHA